MNNILGSGPMPSGTRALHAPMLTWFNQAVESIGNNEIMNTLKKVHLSFELSKKLSRLTVISPTNIQMLATTHIQSIRTQGTNKSFSITPVIWTRITKANGVLSYKYDTSNFVVNAVPVYGHVPLGTFEMFKILKEKR